MKGAKGWACACSVFRRSLYCSSTWGGILFWRTWEEVTYSSSWFMVQDWTPIVFSALGKSLNLPGSGSAPVKWGQLYLTTWKGCWLVNACKMLYSAVKYSVALRSIWSAVTVVLLWNFMAKRLPRNKMTNGHRTCGLWETRGWHLSKGGEPSCGTYCQPRKGGFPRPPAAVWRRNRCWMRLGLRRGALEGAEGLLAPLSAARSRSCPRPQPPPPLLCWWSCLRGGTESQVGSLIQMGGKMEKKVFVVVGLSFWMDPLFSIVYHVATNTRTSMVKRLVRGWEQVSGEKAGLGLMKLFWHWRWCHEVCYPNPEAVAITGFWRCEGQESVS